MQSMQEFSNRLLDSLIPLRRESREWREENDRLEAALRDYLGDEELERKAAIVGAKRSNISRSRGGSRS